MFKKSLGFLILSLLLVSTTSFSLQKPYMKSEDKKFEDLATEYIESFLKMNPENATALGDHRYDGLFNDYSASGVEKKLQFNKDTLKKINSIDFSHLSLVNKVDFRILKSNVESENFELETIKSYELNPLSYNVGNAIYNLIARDFAPLKDRLLSVKERLKGIPAVLENAKINLKNPPRIHTETAILQNKGNIGLIKEDLNSFIEQVPELKDELALVQATAIEALEKYGVWLEKDLLPKSTGDFRLGDKKFTQKLRYTVDSDLKKEEILKRAEAELKKTQETLYQVALPLYKQYFPELKDPKKLEDKKQVIKSVLNKLAESTPNNETIVDLARKDLEECTKFVKEKDLMSVPTEPVKIIVMPEFQRGVAVAYCEPPGALEKNGETFYSISPTPKDWTTQRVESFFKEYNTFMLQNLTIHEAMPGHYLQLADANKFKAPTMIRAMFQSGTFTEGWATYAEQLMVEKGYGGSEVKMQQLKMRLRLLINAILDQKIHIAGMTEKEAMDLMMNEGFQEEGEAAGKWRRACLSSTQLSTYFVGNTEINEIRKAYETKKGKKGSLKDLHDTMLSFGSPSPKYVKELMGLQ